jgi:ATP-binding cassette, subfamily B, bacterial
MSISLVHVLRDPDREPDTRPLDMRLLRRLWQLLSPYPAKRNWLLLTVILRAIQLPLLAWSIGAVINGPIAGGQGTMAIIAGGLAVLGFSLFTQITFFFRSLLALDLGERVIVDLRRAVFAHLQRMPMSFYQRTKVGRVISRITSDCENVRIGVQDVLFISLVQLGQMVGAGLLLAWCDWQLFAVVLTVAPMYWLINQGFRHRLSAAYRNMSESFSRLTATLAESVAGIRVTQGFAREEVNAAAFTRLMDRHSKIVMTANNTSGLFTPLLELGGQASLAAALLVGGFAAIRASDPMPVGDLIQFWFLAGMFFSPIQILGQQYNQALTSMAGAERVFGLLDTTPEWEDAADAVRLPRGDGEVVFENVSFGYHADRMVLRNIHLTAHAGQRIALVGPTGSGKSSLISLVARFFHPQTGRVLVDGHDLRNVRGDSLADQLAIVLQQNFLFSGSVLDNLRIGKPNASLEEAIDALRGLDCGDLVEQLPNGLHTTVGNRGTSLSLGQRQLICFARAMLANPRILILDEATSAIDTLTEQRIQHALEKLMQGRTTFIVAHRLSTIQSADQVLVIDQGQIVQRGTHAQLIDQPGRYASLYHRFCH